jgi:hypothetical protein
MITLKMHRRHLRRAGVTSLLRHAILEATQSPRSPEADAWALRMYSFVAAILAPLAEPVKVHAVVAEVIYGRSIVRPARYARP